MSDINATTFSVRSVPDSWVAAQEEAGGLDTKPLKKNRPVRIVPIRQDADVLTGSVAALAISVICGVFWYMYETGDVGHSPWLAVPAGMLIAFAVRLGTGPDFSDLRATIALIFYFLTVFCTAFFIESHDFVLVFGERPGFAELQTELVRDRLTQPTTMLAWLVGIFATLQTGFALNRRQRRRF